MTQYIENYETDVQQTGFNTLKNATFGGTVAITGATTITGALTVTGIVSGPQQYNVIQSALVGATVQLITAQTDSVCINRSTSGSPSWTLPANAPMGTAFTFVTANTTAGYTVTSASQVIHFKTSASGTVLTSTTTLTNTQATAIVGDFISIICDGTAWWMTGISGIYAAS